MNAENLRWEEWRFDQIGKELVLCIYWEYARESTSIRSLVARYVQLRKDFLVKLRHDRDAAEQRLRSLNKSTKEIQKESRKLKAFHRRLSRNFLSQFTNLFPEHFGPDVDEVASALERGRGRIMRDWRVVLPIFATKFAGRIVLEPTYFPNGPWMALPLRVRERIARRVKPFEPVLIERKDWHRYSETRLGSESRITGKTGNIRWEDIVLRIYWSEGTNEEIVSHFRKWLTQYRKSSRVSPPKRTRAAVTKAWLKRLAEMRLWKAGGSLNGALGIIRTHAALETSKAQRSGITKAKDTQLTAPISDKAEENAVREDISRVARDLRHLFGWIVPRNEVPVSYPFRRIK